MRDMKKGKVHPWLTKEGLLKIEGWARDGLIEEQIAHNMGVSRSTLSDWKNKHPLIIQALAKGKEVSDREVENALFKRATGYTYEEITVEREKVDGEFQSIETKRVKRQVPPDTTAIIFWLKNRKTDVWRDRREIDHSGEMKQTVVERKDLSNLSVEELKQIESILKNLPTVEDIQREIARRDYYEYVCYVHEGRYKKAPHSEFVGRIIQDAMDKKKQMNAGEIQMENQYIAINMPPRHSKSMTITETLPSYYLGNFPEDRVIEISYSDTFARRFGKKNKEKVKQYGADLFDIHISKESSAHDEWLLDNEIGGMISRGYYLVSRVWGRT